MADLEGPRVVWRKSTASDSGSCVEVAVVGGSLLVRDSMNRNGPVLRFSLADWSAFLAHASTGDVGLRRA